MLRKRSIRRVAAIAGITLSLAAGFALGARGGEQVAWAQARGEDASRRVIELTLRGDPSEGGRLADTMRELFARLGLTVAVAGTDATPNAASVLARVQVDLAAAGGAHATVTDARDGSLVFERTFAADDTPAIRREAVAHAVRSAVEAELLPVPAPAGSTPPSAESPPTAPPTATPTAPPPPPPPATPSAGSDIGTTPRDTAQPTHGGPASLAFDVATLGGLGLVASGTSVVPRVGLEGTLASRRGLRPSATLGVSYAFPFEAGAEDVAGHASFVSPRLLFGLEPLHSSRFALVTAIGAGADVLSVQPRSDVLPASTLAPSTTRVDVVGTARVTAKLALTSGVALVLAVATDVDGSQRRYVENDGEHAVDVFSPWRVRPAVLFGLEFTALGKGTFTDDGAF